MTTTLSYGLFAPNLLFGAKTIWAANPGTRHGVMADNDSTFLAQGLHLIQFATLLYLPSLMFLGR